MKINMIAILTIVLLLSGCSSDKAKNNDLNQYGLNGKVKSNTLYTYKAENKFGQSEINYDDNFTHTESLFNQKGEHIIINSFNKENELIERTVRKYENGKLIELLVYNKDGELYFTGKFKSNSIDKLEFEGFTKDGEKRSSGNMFFFKNKFIKNFLSIYNENGEIIEEITTIYEYDKNGNKKTQKETNKDGELISFARLELLEFDEHKNWTKAFVFKSEDTDMPENILVRKFEYYSDSDNDEEIVNAKEPIEKIEPMKNGKPLIKFSSLRSLLLGTNWLEVKEILGEPDIHYYVGVSGAESNVYWFAALDDFTNEVVHINVYFVNDYAKTVESTKPGKNMRTSPWESIRTPK